MSFAGDVKSELCRDKHIGKAKHCLMAEISGLLVHSDKSQKMLEFVTENLTVAQKYLILVKKAFDIEGTIHTRGKQTECVIEKQDDILRLARTLKWVDEEKHLTTHPLVHPLLVQRDCCRKAFLRGLFLSCGSITNPNQGYHFEIVLENEEEVCYLKEVFGGFGLIPKHIVRKGKYIVYLKDAEQIVDVLNIMEAPIALMEFENVRILKEMRNSINRQVNCEAANIKKTVSAAERQVEDIQYIRDHGGFGSLSEGLAQIAKLRLENPDVSLKELGEMLDIPIGKSGVNHRLRKLSQIAEFMRKQ